PWRGSGNDDSHFDDDHPFSGGGRVPPFLWRRLWLFTGPGVLMSIAFLDTGNPQGRPPGRRGRSRCAALAPPLDHGHGPPRAAALRAPSGVATGRHVAELSATSTWTGRAARSGSRTGERGRMGLRVVVGPTFSQWRDWLHLASRRMKSLLELFFFILVKFLSLGETE
ncbi:hypothetical protein EE612_005538, partial [Oryza sativa]